ncbi:hypothetical protein [Nakamurella sp. GG22]
MAISAVVHPDIARAARQAVIDRGITLRELFEAALLREIACPSVFHDPANTRRRAPRGSLGNHVMIGAVIDPDVVHRTRQAFAERNVTQRALIEGALAREVTNPTVLDGRKEPHLTNP